MHTVDKGARVGCVFVRRMPGPSAFACASNFIGREIPPSPVGNVADKCSPAMWSIPRRLPHFGLPLFWADTLSRSNTTKNLNERCILLILRSVWDRSGSMSAVGAKSEATGLKNGPSAQCRKRPPGLCRANPWGFASPA